ncbi:MAG: toast rack family protein [bacterium]|jgi:hypothetical protein|nr:hypothetical protein [Gemmatimonadota bacterium]HIL88963.1 hypothetical protein [Gemmatimonadota bacterium]
MKMGRVLVLLGVNALVAILSPLDAAIVQNSQTVTTSQKLEDTDEKRVSIEFSAGRLAIRSIDEGLLYRLKLRYKKDYFKPVTDLSGNRLHLGVERIRKGFSGISNWNSSGGGNEFDLELTREVPMDLHINFGAGSAELDLGGLALTGLEFNTGASESRIKVSAPNREQILKAQFNVGAADFQLEQLGNLNAEDIEINAGMGSFEISLDGSWQRDALISIDMGVGSLELHVPEDLGFQLLKNSFLTSLDGVRNLVKDGNAYYSLNWDEADRNVTVDLDGAVGSVTVRLIR